MPDFDGLTYPNASEVPDGPGAFLQLIQSLSTRLNAITGARQIQTFRKSTLADLNAVAGAVAGDKGYVTSGPGAGEYTRSGVSWVPAYLIDDGGWVTVTPGANWTAGTPVQYRRLNGVVFLRGIISRTTGTDTIFSLPAGFRPAANGVHPVATNSPDNTVRVTVTTAGQVQQTPLASGSFVFLDGVSFIAEI